MLMLIETRHVLGGIGDDVGNDPHAGFGRIDVGVADHELLQDIVLDRARKLVLRDALFLGGDDVEGEARQHRAVHRHAHAHRVQWNAVEQDLHVGERVDRDARLADIADDARVVAVVTAMRREIERDAQPLLPRGEVAAIEGVRFLGGRKARILPDRPRPPGIHARLHAARIGRETGHSGVDIGGIGGGVERLDRDPLGRVPGQVAPFDLAVGERGPVGEGGGLVSHAALWEFP